MRPHSRGMRCPRLASLSPSRKEQRAQGKPGARCTRGLVCKAQVKKRTRAYRFSGDNPAFPAQWICGFLRTLSGDRLSCHRRPQQLLLLRTWRQHRGARTTRHGPPDSLPPRSSATGDPRSQRRPQSACGSAGRCGGTLACHCGENVGSFDPPPAPQLDEFFPRVNYLTHLDRTLNYSTVGGKTVHLGNVR